MVKRDSISTSFNQELEVLVCIRVAGTQKRGEKVEAVTDIAGGKRFKEEPGLGVLPTEERVHEDLKEVCSGHLHDGAD